MSSRQLVAAGVLIGFLASWYWPAGGQEACQGDVNNDGIVDAADVEALPAVLFEAEVEPEMLARADANDDGVVTAADVVAILRLNGFPCAVDATPTPSAGPIITVTHPTATATPTLGVPTDTATMTVTPTTTLTPSPTATPTTVCNVQNLPLGTTNGELTASDCQRDYGGELRYADAYSIVGTPGQAITIDAAGTGDQPILPYIAIIDADGQFAEVDGLPPMEFVVTSSQPYLIFVSSKAGTVQVGTYQVTASVRTCPTPIPVTFSTTPHFGRLDGSECPDPALPDDPAALSPVDVYTFTVTQVPTNVQILMRQTNYNDDIDPVFSVIGPDGYELFPSEDDDDLAPPINSASYPGTDAGARFLATVPGTYTLIAGTNSGLGAYSLQVSSPGAPSCSPSELGTIPSTSPLTRTGQLSGDYAKGCGPPLPVPGVTVGDSGDTDLPQPNSGADLYTFAAQAGDVISVEMDADSNGDAHLFLYGPASAGNPRVAQDANSVAGGAQLAATLALPGIYTIVAANDYALMPPDPVDDYPGDIVNYSLIVQKCPVAGALAAGVPRSSTFTVLDCVGFGGLPFRSYAFTGTAGQFVSVSMTSEDLDSAVRLLGPDGSQVYNADDLFDPSTSDARVNRILPASGTYFVEVSASLSTSGEVELTPPAPGFAVQLDTCATTAAVPGTVSGAFQASDCELPSGRKYDVYTFAGSAAAQRVASIAPPTNGCIVGLYAEGLQTPDGGCSNQGLLEMPAVTTGTYGFMVAANDATVRGNYSLQYRNCPLSTVQFGDSRNGSLSSCTDAAGIAGDWYLTRGAADLVNFNCGVSGEVTTGFGGLVTDFSGASTFLGSFAEDSGTMLPLGGDLAALIKVTGPPPGNYTLSIDTAALRQ